MNGVTIVQVLVAAEKRQAALPAELAGSLVLSVADALLSLALKVGPHELRLLEDGTIRVCGGTPADELSSEKSLRELLDQLLLCSSSVTPALLRASRRESRGNIAELVRELEVALIPTNRGAARRALSRLCREVGVALQQSPQLRQAAEARVHSIERVEIAAAPVPALAPPVPTEPEPVDELEIVELELSPSLPLPVVAPPLAAPVMAPQRSELRKAEVAATFEIPDLEIPRGPKAELVQAVQWQPIEHTVRLEMPARVQGTNSRIPPSAIGYAPMGSCRSAAVQLDFVELSDDDVQEATTELPVKQPLRSVIPPKPPSPVRRFAEALSQESPLLAINAELDSAEETAEPFLLVVPSLEHESPAFECSTTHVEETSEAQAQLVDSVPLLQYQDSFESPFGAVCVEAIEVESSELLESYPQALEVVEVDDCELAAMDFELAAEQLPPNDLCANEMAECESTVLDVATIVDGCEPPLIHQPPPIQWRPHALPEPALSEWVEPTKADLESNSDQFEPNFEEHDSEPEAADLKPWEPHRYSAELPQEASARDLDARIMAFAIRDRDNAAELTRGLRSLAGLTDEGAELSVTPPPMTYAAESSQRSSESSSALVRTLIGLGAVGALALVAGSAIGPQARTAMAASIPIGKTQGQQECIAAVSVADVPVGASVRVTQSGREPSREQVQVGYEPLRFDGLACGTPADLLVRMGERGWYRVPIEPASLRPGANLEPVHLAVLGDQRSNPRSHRHE